jgi:L-ascorbate metabolism protein UlaG (beta-lactamase superfamily)
MAAAAATSQDGFPKHFDGRHFFNPDCRPPAGWLEFFRWKLTGRPQVSPRFISDVEQSIPPKRVEGGALKFTMVNHSTVLLQHGGVNILTDPIWSERASPVSWAGPRRRRAPGIEFENLPPIELVLISHDHYDHLDLPTLRRLAALRCSTFVVPTGTVRLLSSHGIGPLHELDWGESFRTPDYAVHSVPAVHFSGRGIFGRNRSLWCGYVIESQGRLMYFAGDTAFGNHFAQIRDRLGAPNVALLPIGAYEPRWFMSPVHMAPEEAVKAHEILGATTSIAIHHGTFQLADDGIDTPKKELLAIAPSSFIVLNNGESVSIA